ncbi:hypothetical protein MPTK1_1g14040 [Marchantia polymorpha subsp. ruderalis]|uniref:Uncharacterized protein n=2 Tax=Marchantia polymorpha TaxID=3197 RepID=A0AAF6APY0_MARPO|nr:hypothetical protein MARPO_0019s0174 [Marchantia polymorpha]BBM98500.1 hypothetical protein Mp_1g14040 [Marchantia polymorpha subsp. ruderalis]|eukprot:PTQ44771.1 hypothetical protein MARPO_0019s0174 [Marchantia polymorpha]
MVTAVGATAVMNPLSWRVESAACSGSPVDVRQRLVLGSRLSFLPSYFARMQGTHSLQPSKNLEFGGAELLRWKKALFSTTLLVPALSTSRRAVRFHIRSKSSDTKLATNFSKINLACIRMKCDSVRFHIRSKSSDTKLATNF